RRIAVRVARRSGRGQPGHMACPGPGQQRKERCLRYAELTLHCAVTVSIRPARPGLNGGHESKGRGGRQAKASGLVPQGRYATPPRGARAATRACGWLKTACRMAVAKGAVIMRGAASGGDPRILNRARPAERHIQQSLADVVDMVMQTLHRFAMLALPAKIQQIAVI